MKNIDLTLIILLLMAFACGQNKPKESRAESESISIIPTMTKVWETDTVLRTAESVIFDDDRGVLYVSCINGVPPTSLDYDGFIAKVALDGTILDLDWITDSLSAPKGMGIVANSLFVTNITEIREYDINTLKRINTYPVDDAKFLNDITTGGLSGEREIYISDSYTNRIHLLRNGQVSLILEDSTFGNPNGLLCEGAALKMVAFGSGNLFDIDIPSKRAIVLPDTIPNGDGVVAYGEDYLISNWAGEVYHVANGGGKTLLLDTADVKFAADIWYIQKNNLLLVPTFFGNTMAAFEAN